MCWTKLLSVLPSVNHIADNGVVSVTDMVVLIAAALVSHDSTIEAPRDDTPGFERPCTFAVLPSYRLL